jgi:hypothetical protein
MDRTPSRLLARFLELFSVDRKLLSAKVYIKFYFRVVSTSELPPGFENNLLLVDDTSIKSPLATEYRLGRLQSSHFQDGYPAPPFRGFFCIFWRKLTGFPRRKYGSPICYRNIVKCVCGLPVQLHVGFFEQTANHNFPLTTRAQNATGKFISLKHSWNAVIIG